jgi:hypothetical protein
MEVGNDSANNRLGIRAGKSGLAGELEGAGNPVGYALELRAFGSRPRETHCKARPISHQQERKHETNS